MIMSYDYSLTILPVDPRPPQKKKINRNIGKMLHNVGSYGNNQKYIQDNIIICG